MDIHDFTYMPTIYWIRNNWVYDYRIEIFDDDFETYKKLVGYDHMMSRFWCWSRNPESWFQTEHK